MPFNPKHELQQIPVPMLERYFSKFPEFAQFDWAPINKRNIGPVFLRIRQMPASQQAEVISLLRKTDQLGDSRGALALIEAARQEGFEIAPRMKELRNGHQRAFWCYLEHPSAFQRAELLARMAARPKSRRETSNGLPKGPISVTEDMLRQLGTALSEYFDSREGRGFHCTVDHRQQPGADHIHIFTAYPADFGGDELDYDEDGRLDLQYRQPPFVVSFILDTLAGTAETTAPVPPISRQELTRIFSRVILGHDQAPKRWQEAAYDLEKFRELGRTFPAIPENGVAWGRIKSITFGVRGCPAGSLEVKLAGSDPSATIEDLMRNSFAIGTEWTTDLEIKSVRMQAGFLPGFFGPRQSLAFDIYPTHASLADGPEAKAVRTSLRKWEIASDA